MEWSGTEVNDWPLIRLDDVVVTTDFVANGSFASLKENVRYNSDSAYAVLIRTTDFTKGWNGEYVWVDRHAYEFLSKSRLEPGDLVLCNVGSVGIVFLVPNLGKPMTLGPNAVLCRSRDPQRLSQHFLLHYFSSNAGQEALRSITSATAQKKFNKSRLRAQRIPIPTLAEQHRIVNVIEEQFSRLDAAVSGLRRARANLKRYRTSVLKSAVEGQLLKTEEVRTQELPAGWIWTKLGELISQGPQNGLYKPGSSYGQGMPILRIDDFQDWYFRPRAELRQVELSGAEEKMFSMEAGDFIINRVNSPSHLGKCLVVPTTLCPAVFESNMMRMRFSSSAMPQWIATVLRSRDGKARLVANAKWAVNQASINQRDVESTRVPLPPLAEQERIVAEVERQFSILDAMEATVDSGLKRAHRLRESILREAFARPLRPALPVGRPHWQDSQPVR